jgi:apolipoprotein N-acyltransferase
MAELASAWLLRGAGPTAPAQLAALRLAGLQGFRRYASAFLLGVLAAAALPPVDLTPVLLISFAGLVWLCDGARRPREAFGIGWSFGFGFFLAGLYWIAAALFVDIAQFWWLLPFAAMGVPAGLAIFSGAAALGSHLVCRALRWRGTSRILALAAAWCVAEWLRGHVLTGLPWNLLGYAWSGGFPGSLAMLQTTAVIGIYGLTLITTAVAMLPAVLGDFASGRRAALIVGVLVLAACLGFGYARLGAGPPPDVPGVRLRIVQPSIPQTLRNDPAAEVQNFRRLMALSASEGAGRVTTVIWSEGSAPAFPERSRELRAALAAAAPGNGYLIAGTERSDPPPARAEHIWNSLVALDNAGIIRGSYDKAHLVPFGEYVPLRAILPLDKITPGTTDFSAGPGPATLHLAGLPPFSPLICYEAIFPGAAIDANDRPQWLLNITNDAWYGFTSGPFQHFNIARVRAIEEGLPLVRAANNGISGVVDPYGRVVRYLGLDAIGVVDVNLPQALPPTLYTRLGEAPFWIGLLVMLGLAAITARRSDRKTPAA